MAGGNIEGMNRATRRLLLLLLLLLLLPLAQPVFSLFHLFKNTDTATTATEQQQYSKTFLIKFFIVRPLFETSWTIYASQIQTIPMYNIRDERESEKKTAKSFIVISEYIYFGLCVCVCFSLFIYYDLLLCVFLILSFFSYFFLFFSFRWVCITTSLWLHRMDDSNLVYKDGNINASRTRSTQTRTVITTVSSFFFLFSFSSSFLDWSDGWCRAHLRMNRMNEMWRREVEARTK